jgi:hypothetical protein
LSFKFGGADLALVETFKFLGMMFHKDGKLSAAANLMSGAFAGAINRIRIKASDLSVHDHPHVMLWLFKVFALPAALYGCQVWSTNLMDPVKCGKSKLQKFMNSFLCQQLGVKRSTRTDCLLRESGCLPLWFYWLRCILRFWNSLKDTNSTLLSKVVRADLQLAGTNQLATHRCWTSDVRSALQSLQNNLGGRDEFYPHVSCIHHGVLERIDFKKCMQSVLSDVLSHNVQAGAGDPRAPHVDNLKLVTYQQWFAHSDVDFVEGPYLSANLNKQVISSLARFRLSSHHFGVEVARWQNAVDYNQARLCVHCGEVDDELHAIFECSLFDDLREGHAAAFANVAFKDMKGFFNQPAVLIANFVHQCMCRCDAHYHSDVDDEVVVDLLTDVDYDVG